jgi:eukaryotic-like serine/threonine-protein kinase
MLEALDHPGGHVTLGRPVSGGVEVKNVPSIRSLSSRWLAVSCAALYLVVSAVVGFALLATPRPGPASAAARNDPTYVAEQNVGDGTTTTVVTTRPPNGFQRVTGPEMVQTVIPIGWRVARGGAPGAMRATDPNDSGRFVGYGGAPAVTSDITATHAANETKFAERTDDYERVDLNRATYAGNPAIEWEYKHDDGSGRQHVRTLFWHVDGIEYFISASGPERQWRRMQLIYEEMVANSRP